MIEKLADLYDYFRNNEIETHMHLKDLSILKDNRNIKWDQPNMDFFVKCITDIQDRCFAFYLLNIVESVPVDLCIISLKEIIKSGSYSLYYYAKLDVINRLWGWENVEQWLQNEFKNTYSEQYRMVLTDFFKESSMNIPYYYDKPVDFYTKYTWKFGEFHYHRTESLYENQDIAKQDVKRINDLIKQRNSLIISIINVKQELSNLLSKSYPLLPKDAQGYSDDKLDEYVDFKNWINKVLIEKGEDIVHFR